MFRRKIIYGCEERGDALLPYLTRYTLFQCKAFQVCLHVFHRSDNVEHHDHPWNFLSIILWRGYLEETPVWPHCDQCGDKMNFYGKHFHCNYCGEDVLYNKEPRIRKRVRPGMILFRQASHRHRVVLVDEKRAVTLVIMGKRVREWGFFTDNGWIQWTKYFFKKGC